MLYTSTFHDFDFNSKSLLHVALVFATEIKDFHGILKFHCFLSNYFFILDMNNRMIVIAIILGIVITVAFFIGCPNKAIGCLGFDMSR